MSPNASSRTANGRRVVFFDLDDTLYDHRTASRAALRALRDDYPSLRRRPVEWLFSRYAQALETGHRRLMAGRLTPANARVLRMRFLFRGAGEELSAREATHRMELYRTVYQAHERSIPGSAALLRSLRRRHRVGILSNNRTREQRGKLARIGLAPLIDLLVTSEMTGWAKPDRRIFTYALRAAGVEARGAVMVGDSWAADIRGAIDAGMPAVWFNRDGAPLPEPLPVAAIARWTPAAEAAKTIEGRFPGPNSS